MGNSESSLAEVTARPADEKTLFLDRELMVVLTGESLRDVDFVTSGATKYLGESESSQDNSKGKDTVAAAEVAHEDASVSAGLVDSDNVGYLTGASSALGMVSHHSSPFSSILDKRAAILKRLHVSFVRAARADAAARADEDENASGADGVGAATPGVDDDPFDDLLGGAGEGAASTSALFAGLSRDSPATEALAAEVSVQAGVAILMSLLKSAARTDPVLCNDILRYFSGLLNTLPARAFAVANESLTARGLRTARDFFEYLASADSIANDGQRIVATSSLIGMALLSANLPDILTATRWLMKDDCPSVRVARFLGDLGSFSPTLTLDPPTNSRHESSWLKPMSTEEKLAGEDTLAPADEVMPEAIACDGAFVYLLDFKSLAKVGTGKRNTIPGRLYRENKDFLENHERGWLVYAAGQLFYRGPSTAPAVLKVIDTETLQVVGDVMPDGSGSYVTVNNSSVSTWRPEHDPAETVDTPEELLGDRILNRTPLITDGSLLYLISEATPRAAKSEMRVDVFNPKAGLAHVRTLVLQARPDKVGHTLCSRTDGTPYGRVSVDLDLRFPCDGKVTEWSLYCPGHNVGSVKLGVFRRQAGTNYRCIGLNEVDTSFEGKRTIPVDPADQIEFKAGDYIGVYWKNDRNQICCSGTGRMATQQIESSQTYDVGQMMTADNQLGFRLSIEAGFINTSAPEQLEVLYAHDADLAAAAKLEFKADVWKASGFYTNGDVLNILTPGTNNMVDIHLPDAWLCQSFSLKTGVCVDYHDLGRGLKAKTTVYDRFSNKIWSYDGKLRSVHVYSNQGASPRESLPGDIFETYLQDEVAAKVGKSMEPADAAEYIFGHLARLSDYVGGSARGAAPIPFAESTTKETLLSLQELFLSAAGGLAGKEAAENPEPALFLAYSVLKVLGANLRLVLANDTPLAVYGVVSRAGAVNPFAPTFEALKAIVSTANPGPVMELIINEACTVIVDGLSLFVPVASEQLSLLTTTLDEYLSEATATGRLSQALMSRFTDLNVIRQFFPLSFAVDNSWIRVDDGFAPEAIMAVVRGLVASLMREAQALLDKYEANPGECKAVIPASETAHLLYAFQVQILSTLAAVGEADRPTCDLVVDYTHMVIRQAIGLVERATVVSEDMAAAGVDNVHLLEAMESSLVGRVIPPLMDALLPITEAFELAFASRVASPTQRLFQALDRLHAVSPSAKETVDAGDFLTGSVLQKEWVEETPHQYENNMRDDRKISMPGAAELTLHFDPQCRTENGCDWLGIYTGPNQSGTLLRKLTGPSVNWPKAPFKVPVGTIYLYFYTDGSCVEWGWKVKITGEVSVVKLTLTWSLELQKNLSVLVGRAACGLLVGPETDAEEKGVVKYLNSNLLRGGLEDLVPSDATEVPLLPVPDQGGDDDLAVIGAVSLDEAELVYALADEAYESSSPTTRALVDALLGELRSAGIGPKVPGKPRPLDAQVEAATFGALIKHNALLAEAYTAAEACAAGGDDGASSSAASGKGVPSLSLSLEKLTPNLKACWELVMELRRWIFYESRTRNERADEAGGENTVAGLVLSKARLLCRFVPLSATPDLPDPTPSAAAAAAAANPRKTAKSRWAKVRMAVNLYGAWKRFRETLGTRPEATETTMSQDLITFLKADLDFGALSRTVVRRCRRAESKRQGLIALADLLSGCQMVKLGVSFDLALGLPAAFRKAGLLDDRIAVHPLDDIHGCSAPLADEVMAAVQASFTSLTSALNRGECDPRLQALVLDLWNMQIRTADREFVLKSNILPTLWSMCFGDLADARRAEIEAMTEARTMSPDDEPEDFFSDRLTLGRVGKAAWSLFQFLVLQCMGTDVLTKAGKKASDRERAEAEVMVSLPAMTPAARKLLPRNMEAVLDETVFDLIFGFLYASLKTIDEIAIRHQRRGAGEVVESERADDVKVLDKIKPEFEVVLSLVHTLANNTVMQRYVCQPAEMELVLRVVHHAGISLRARQVAVRILRRVLPVTDPALLSQVSIPTPGSSSSAGASSDSDEGFKFPILNNSSVVDVLFTLAASCVAANGDDDEEEEADGSSSSAAPRDLLYEIVMLFRRLLKNDAWRPVLQAEIDGALAQVPVFVSDPTVSLETVAPDHPAAHAVIGLYVLGGLGDRLRVGGRVRVSSTMPMEGIVVGIESVNNRDKTYTIAVEDGGIKRNVGPALLEVLDEVEMDPSAYGINDDNVAIFAALLPFSGGAATRKGKGVAGDVGPSETSGGNETLKWQLCSAGLRSLKCLLPNRDSFRAVVASDIMAQLHSAAMTPTMLPRIASTEGLAARILELRNNMDAKPAPATLKIALRSNSSRVASNAQWEAAIERAVDDEVGLTALDEAWTRFQNMASDNLVLTGDSVRQFLDETQVIDAFTTPVVCFADVLHVLEGGFSMGGLFGSTSSDREPFVEADVVARLATIREAHGHLASDESEGSSFRLTSTATRTKATQMTTSTEATEVGGSLGYLDGRTLFMAVGEPEIDYAIAAKDEAELSPTEVARLPVVKGRAILVAAPTAFTLMEAAKHYSKLGASAIVVPANGTEERLGPIDALADDEKQSLTAPIFVVPTDAFENLRLAALGLDGTETASDAALRLKHYAYLFGVLNSEVELVGKAGAGEAGDPADAAAAGATMIRAALNNIAGAANCGELDSISDDVETYLGKMHTQADALTTAVRDGAASAMADATGALSTLGESLHALIAAAVQATSSKKGGGAGVGINPVDYGYPAEAAEEAKASYPGDSHMALGALRRRIGIPSNTTASTQAWEFDSDGFLVHKATGRVLTAADANVELREPGTSGSDAADAQQWTIDIMAGEVMRNADGYCLLPGAPVGDADAANHYGVPVSADSDATVAWTFDGTRVRLKDSPEWVLDTSPLEPNTVVLNQEGRAWPADAVADAPDRSFDMLRTTNLSGDVSYALGVGMGTTYLEDGVTLMTIDQPYRSKVKAVRDKGKERARGGPSDGGETWRPVADVPDVGAELVNLSKSEAALFARDALAVVYDMIDQEDGADIPLDAEEILDSLYMAVTVTGGHLVSGADLGVRAEVQAEGLVAKLAALMDKTLADRDSPAGDAIREASLNQIVGHLVRLENAFLRAAKIDPEAGPALGVPVEIGQSEHPGTLGRGEVQVDVPGAKAVHVTFDPRSCTAGDNEVVFKVAGSTVHRVGGPPSNWTPFVIPGNSFTYELVCDESLSADEINNYVSNWGFRFYAAKATTESLELAALSAPNLEYVVWALTHFLETRQYHVLDSVMLDTLMTATLAARGHARYMLIRLLTDVLACAAEFPGAAEAVAARADGGGGGDSFPGAFVSLVRLRPFYTELNARHSGSTDRMRPMYTQALFELLVVARKAADVWGVDCPTRAPVADDEVVEEEELVIPPDEIEMLMGMGFTMAQIKAAHKADPTANLQVKIDLIFSGVADVAEPITTPMAGGSGDGEAYGGTSRTGEEHVDIFRGYVGDDAAVAAAIAASEAAAADAGASTSATAASDGSGSSSTAAAAAAAESSAAQVPDGNFTSFATHDEVITSFVDYSTFKLPVTVTAGMWYYEVILHSPGDVRVGWCYPSADIAAAEAAGSAPDSWAFTAGSGNKPVKINGGERAEFAATEGPWVGGDVVGVAIDVDEGTISISVNGKFYGVAFRGLSFPAGVCPVVSIGRDQSAAINLGGEYLHCFRTSGFDQYLPIERLAADKAKDAGVDATWFDKLFDNVEFVDVLCNRSAPVPYSRLLKALAKYREMESGRSSDTMPLAVLKSEGGDEAAGHSLFNSAVPTLFQMAEVGGTVVATWKGGPPRLFSASCVYVQNKVPLREDQSGVKDCAVWITMDEPDLNLLADYNTLTHGDWATGHGLPADQRDPNLPVAWIRFTDGEDTAQADVELAYRSGRYITFKFLASGGGAANMPMSVMNLAATGKAVQDAPLDLRPNGGWQTRSWTLERDADLVRWSREVCADRTTRYNSITVQELTEPSSSKYPSLVGVERAALWSRFILLRHFSASVDNLLPMLDLRNVGSPGTLADTFSCIRSAVYIEVTAPLFRQVRDSTNYGRNTDADEVRVDRLRASDAKLRQVRVLRESIIGQSCDHVMGIAARELRCTNRGFKVKFLNEGSTDAGGPYRDFFSNIGEECMSEELPLFVPSPNNKGAVGSHREMWVPNPSATSVRALRIFEYLGRLMAMCMRSSETLALTVGSTFWKQICLEPMSLRDLEEMDYMAVQIYDMMLGRGSGPALSREDFEASIEEYFTVTLSNGHVVELCPGGADRRVTYDNRREYVRLAVHRRLHESEIQVDAIRRGMAPIVPIEMLSLFPWHEVETAICGVPEINVEILRRNTVYESCSMHDPHVQLLWAVLESFSHEERSAFLRFVWGRGRLPSTDPNTRLSQEMKITAYHRSNPGVDGFHRGDLPQAHTCFNSIELPRYPNFTHARERILLAITACSSVDTDHQDFAGAAEWADDDDDGGVDDDDVDLYA